MKITERERPRWWAGRQATCGYCRTVLELAVADDVVEPARGSGARRNGHIQCWVCGHSVTVSHRLDRTPDAISSPGSPSSDRQ